MKKLIFLTLSSIMVFNGLAFSDDDVQRKSIIVDRYSYTSSFYEDKSDALDACRRDLTSTLNKAEENLDSHFGNGYEYECREIIIKSETDTHSSFEGHGTIWEKLQHRYIINFTVRCIPRKLSEKTIYSMAKRCEQNPREECFSDDILSKMDSIGITNFKYEHDGRRCSPLH